MHQLCDILVATPGRLTHAIRECPDLDLSHLRYLVIDEADRMMENIAQDWLNILEVVVYTAPGRGPASSQLQLPTPPPFLCRSCCSAPRSATTPSSRSS